MTVAGAWNMENLFRPGDDFGPHDDDAYQAKIHGLADTIGQTGADVLAVEEVGDPAALDDVAALLDGDWQTVTSAIFERAHPIRVGFLSRLPLEVIADVAAFPQLLRPVQADDTGATIQQMGRGALAVRIRESSGRDLHDEGERARVAGYALDRRTAEAVTVRALADDLLAGEGTTRQVMVVGDLNDEPQAATTQILLGPPGSELGTPGADRPDQGDAARLWNLAPRLPEGERYSRIYHGRGELIDHLLVSHALLGRTAEVHTLHPGTLPSITDAPAVRRNAPASDHALIYTRLSS